MTGSATVSADAKFEGFCLRSAYVCGGSRKMRPGRQANKLILNLYALLRRGLVCSFRSISYCPLASRIVTRQKAEQKRQKAVDFLNRIGESEKADEFATMSTQEYIDHKGLQVTNNPRRNCFMPQRKADLQDILDSVQDLLENVYTPESSREELAAAVGDARDQLTGEDEDADDANDNGDDDDNGD